MMKKWFFSDNGKVTSPLSNTEALAYVADKPNAYGWHPSFNQWKPISCIPEFADAVPLVEQTSLATKELTDKFLAKKLRLEKKLLSIEDSIGHTKASFSKFEKQISNYNALTQNLSDEVKGAIANIEKKYDALNKKISQVKNAINIAEVEMNDAIKSFELRVDSNDVSMPSCLHSSKNSSADNITSAATVNADDELSQNEAAQISKAKLAQAKLATPHQRLDTDIASTNTAALQESKTKPKGKKSTDVENNVSTKDAHSPVETESKDSFNGMKSMMKSVFKADKKAEPEIKEQQPMSMADRLRMAQNNG